MSTPLVDQFSGNHGQSSRLAEVMNACRRHYRFVAITVIGCGDAFINRYWPKLQLLVNQGWVKLIVVDRAPLKQLIAEKISLARQAFGESASAAQLTQRYGGLVQLLEQRPDSIKYLNVEDENDCAWYNQLTQDIVFVLVPDDIHVKYARDWLRRATLVLVEKPYNRDLFEAQKFTEILNKMVRVNGENNPHTLVVCIDHYLAKIFSCVTRFNEEMLQQKTGVIKRIEFSICEAGGVEPWRASSLDAGMVYDLFCHVLAQASPFLKLDTFLSGGEGHSQVRVAKHKDCPIRRESYARIESPGLQDFYGRQVTLSGVLGKGIGQKDVKFLRVIGEHGTLFADFGPHSDGYLRLETAGQSSVPLFEIGKGHPEMLDAITQGRFLKEPVGGLTSETAVTILQIIRSIRDRIEDNIGRMDEQCYPIGAEPGDIDKIAVKLT